MIPFLLSYRSRSRHRFELPFTELSSFGLLAGAELFYRFRFSAPIPQNLTMTAQLYSRTEMWYFNLRPFTLDDGCYSADFTARWTFNISMVKGDREFSKTLNASEKQVIVPVLLHCPSDGFDDVEFWLDVFYDNIQTLVDFRELPNFITVPIFLSVEGFVLLAWVAASLMTRRRF
jgi:hypothetical protein